MKIKQEFLSFREFLKNDSRLFLAGIFLPVRGTSLKFKHRYGRTAVERGKKVRTMNGWPSEADDNVKEAGCLVFITGSGESQKTVSVFYDTFQEAAAAFASLYAEYPGVIWEGGKWEPDYNHRCCVPHHTSEDGTWWNAEYGNQVILFYKDGRRKGWQKPDRDKDGHFYRGAFVKQTAQHTVPGYGRMQRGQRKRDDLLPRGTARGDWKYENPDPVNIGGVTVDQAELNRVYKDTGEFPTHLTVWDPSRSCLYLKEIIWGEESEIVAKESV